MESPGGCNIQQFGMTVIHRVLFSVRIQYQHGVKFQAFGVLHRKYQDAVSKDRLLQAALQYVHILSQGFFDFFGALRTAANHRRSVKTFLPPPGTDFCRLPYHLFPAFLLFHCHCFTVADNGFHRIAGEMSMVQDIGGKI